MAKKISRKSTSNKKFILRIHCIEHPDYIAESEPETCHACKMIYFTRVKYADGHGIRVSKISIPKSA